ncbi:MAG TPA: glycosyltransferase family 4 protein [Methylophilaceae bacterium]|jgi:glycosyltransferase involved in cell wall biosynthesis
MIAIVNPQYYGVHGIARYIDSFLANLPEMGSFVYLITGEPELGPVKDYPNVNFIHIPVASNRLGLLIWSIKARQVILRLYAQNKIKYVNFHFPPLIPGLFLPNSVPMILTAHTTYLGMSGNFYNPRLFTGQWGKLSVAIKSWMEKRIFAKASKVIALTEQGRQEVLAYGYQREVFVIPNGADTIKFTPDLSTKKDIDVLFCGRIELRKGSRPMVEVCKRLVSLNANIKIAIVGYGDDDAWVKQHLSAYANNIFLAGKVPFDEMVGFYNRSRLYASTSYYEGLPGTCLEAMSMQIPAVTWDLPFYHDLVVEGKTGRLIPPNNINLMAEKIISQLGNEDLCKTMGERARELLKTKYNWEMLVKAILAIFW